VTGRRQRLREKRPVKVILGDPNPPPEDKPALGWLFAILTAMVASVAFVTAKPVLDYLDPLSFSLSQFAIATVLSFVWLLAHREFRQLTGLSPGQWTFLVTVALLFVAAVYTMWIGLSTIPATAAAVLNRLEVMVTVFLGIALLGDHFTRREGLGAAAVVLGVFVLRFQAPRDFSAGFWMMVLSAVLFGLIQILTKTRVHEIPPRVFTFARNGLAFLLFFIASLWRLVMNDPPGWRALMDWDGVMRGLPLIAATALAGPVLARTLFTFTLKHMELSRATLIQQIQPLLVAVGSAIALQTLPARREWMGGLLIMAGCLLLVEWNWRKRNAPADAGGGSPDPDLP
jgi:drug/metabolite transporter (DMT)-like permease